ncbi:MAG TPA: FAD-dependent monooxygenase [Usitatibacter sp.]|nr:FAD-dependent monooxygenase [Usitatibacter sp.]
MGPDLLDVAVVGAGPVGAVAAALCARHGRRVEVFEARTAPATDARTLALSHASRELIESAGGWPRSGTTAIDTIHISQKGAPGRTLLSACDQGLAALGYTVGFGALTGALAEGLARSAVPVRYGCACDEIALDGEGATLRFASGGNARARLLVLADGGANASRIPGLAFHEKDYGQVAVVARVTADRPHQGRAYERFTPQGPVALLPVEAGYALVYTARPREAERLLGLADATFLLALQAHFGDRAGRFTAVEARASFPLRLRAINVPVALRTAIVGNAAQALHPIAGQGLNLGLRDAVTLADLVQTAPDDAIGSPGMLQAYAGSRRRDATRGIAFTDFLASAFAEGSFAPSWGRGLALTLLDLLPPARRALAQRMIHGAAR